MTELQSLIESKKIGHGFCPLHRKVKKWITLIEGDLSLSTEIGATSIDKIVQTSSDAKNLIAAHIPPMQ